MRTIAVVLLAGLAMAQTTPKSMVEAYDAIADTILATKKAEYNIVAALLDGHFHGAQAYHSSGQFDKAAAEMALFGNEGDNAIGGIRKKLLEGGHHHHSDGEAKGTYEPGFVIVTRETKQNVLKTVAAYKQAKSDQDREKAWKQFSELAHAALSH